MRRASTWIRSALPGAGALAGLLGAHALDYRLLVADPVRRAEVLASTGHAWLPAIESVAVACAVAAVAGAIWTHFGTRGSERPRTTAVRLATIQSIGFVALELGERAFAGAPLHHLTPMLLAAGVLLQVLTGTAVAGALALLGRAGARIARTWRAAPRRPHRAPRPVPAPRTRAAFVRRPILAADDQVRGPPASIAL